MIRINFIYVLALTMVIFGGCKANKGTGNVVYTGDNSATSLDWEGNYTGIVPCADCEGIQTSIQLNRDETYSMTTRYLGKSEEIYKQEGTFSWNSASSSIQLSDMESGPDLYLVGENNLFQLDKEGNRITGELADRYVLRKIDQEAKSQLTSKKWKLVEMMGKPIENSDPEENVIFVTFSDTDNRITGFAGCNNFFGQFEWTEETRIRFSKFGSTQKYCDNTMETETEFLKFLETVDNYTINDGILNLNRARMATLLKFEVIE